MAYFFAISLGSAAPAPEPEQQLSASAINVQPINSQNMLMFHGYFHGGRYERFRRAKIIAPTSGDWDVNAQNAAGATVTNNSGTLRFYRHDIDAGGIDVPFNGTGEYTARYQRVDEETGEFGSVVALSSCRPASGTTTAFFSFAMSALSAGWHLFDIDITAGDAEISSGGEIYRTGVYDPATNTTGWSCPKTFYYVRPPGDDGTSNWFPVETGTYDSIFEWTKGFTASLVSSNATSITYGSSVTLLSSDAIGSRITWSSQTKRIIGWNAATRTATISGAWNPVPTPGQSTSYNNAEKHFFFIEPVTAAPAHKPLIQRYIARAVTALSNTGSVNNNFYRDQLVPYNERAPWRMVGPKPYSTWTYQNYFFSGLFSRYPSAHPQIDGPRNVGTFQMPTAILAGRLGGCIAINPWRAVRIDKEGTITTLFGWRDKNNIAQRVQENLPEDDQRRALDLVGNWDAKTLSEGSGLFEPWNMAWDWETLPTNVSGATIGGEPTHVSGMGPTLFVPDTRHNRIIRAQASPTDRNAPWTITTLYSGLRDPWALSLKQGEVEIYVTERRGNRILKIHKDTGAYLGDLIADPVGYDYQFADVPTTGTTRRPEARAYTVAGTSNNGAGAIRITIAATSTWARTGTNVDVTQVSGANGNWNVTAFTSTQFDLDGSTHGTGTYTLGASPRAIVSIGCIENQTCILPEGIDRQGDWIYWGSMVARQIKRTHVSGGGTQIVCARSDLSIDDNSYFVQFAVTGDADDAARGGFGEPGTVFAHTWSIDNRGFPQAFRPIRSIANISSTGTTCTVVTNTSHFLATGQVVKIYGALDNRYNGRVTVTVTSSNAFTYTAASGPAASPATTTSGLYCVPEWIYHGDFNNTIENETGKSSSRPMSYGSAVGVGYGALYTGSAAEGIARFTRTRTSGDMAVAQASYTIGLSKYFSRGYLQRHGMAGFGKFGHALPWGEDRDIDYYLSWSGHQRDWYRETAAALVPGTWSSSITQNQLKTQAVRTGDINAPEYFDSPGTTTSVVSGKSWSNELMADGGGIWLRGHHAFMYSGGGHNDHPDSGIFVLDLNTMLWNRVAESMQYKFGVYDDGAADSGNFKSTDVSQYYPHPRATDLRRGPTSGHAYGGIEFMEDRNKVFFWSAAPIYDANGTVGGYYQISATSSQRYWDKATGVSIGTRSGGGVNCVSWWLPDGTVSGTSTGRIFRLTFHGDQLSDQPRLVDIDTGATELCGSANSATRMSQRGPGCVIPDPFNPGRKAYIGFYDSTRCGIHTRIDVTPNPVDAITLHPYGNPLPGGLLRWSDDTPDGLGGEASKARWLYLGETEEFYGTRKLLVFHHRAGLFTLDMDTWEWSTVSDSTPPLGFVGSPSTWKNFFYDDINRVFCYVSQVNGEVYQYKLPPGTLNITALHSGGQTFVTRPDAMTGVSGQNFRYNLYRHTVAITSANLGDAELLQSRIWNNSAQLFGGYVDLSSPPGYDAGARAIAEAWTSTAIPINATSTNIVLNTTSGFLTTNSTFLVKIDAELLQVRNGWATAQWSVNRGAYSTTAATHAIGTTVTCFVPPRVAIAGGAVLNNFTALAVNACSTTGVAYYAFLATTTSGVVVETVRPGVNSMVSGIVETRISGLPRAYARFTSNARPLAGSSSFAITSGGRPALISLHASQAAGGPPPQATIGDYVQYWGDASMGYQPGLHTAWSIFQDNTSGVEPFLKAQPRDGFGRPDGQAVASPEAWHYGYAYQAFSGAPVRMYRTHLNRLLGLVDHLVRRYQVDPNRISVGGQSMGGAGSHVFMFRHPDKISAGFTGMGAVRRWEANPQGWMYIAPGQPFGVPNNTPPNPLGTAAGAVILDDGVTAWGSGGGHIDIVGLVSGTRNDLPVVVGSFPTNDQPGGIVPFVDFQDFANALQNGRHGYACYWHDGAHAPDGLQNMQIESSGAEAWATYGYSTFALNVSYPAFSNASIDDNMASDIIGGRNVGFQWTAPVETSTTYSISIRNLFMNNTPTLKGGSSPNRYYTGPRLGPFTTMTTDVTLRRRQAFTPASGTTVNYSYTPDGGALVSGSTVVDSHRNITIPAMVINWVSGAGYTDLDLTL